MGLQEKAACLQFPRLSAKRQCVHRGPCDHCLPASGVAGRAAIKAAERASTVVRPLCRRGTLGRGIDWCCSVAANSVPLYYQEGDFVTFLRLFCRKKLV